MLYECHCECKDEVVRVEEPVSPEEEALREACECKCRPINIWYKCKDGITDSNYFIFTSGKLHAEMVVLEYMLKYHRDKADSDKIHCEPL